MTDRSVHHSVYVVELKVAVRHDRKFAAENPDADPRKACLYIGMTGLDPRERFENHKNGYKSARLVRRFGWRLRPALYAHLNPMSYDEARAMEVKLAQELRAQGYAVWQK